MPLIQQYDLEVFTPPCSPESVRFAAKAHFVTDIREALPYLNAELTGAQYNPAAPALNWRRDTHHIVFNVNEIAIGNLVDRAEAEALARELVDVVNHTWANRTIIEPDHTAYQRAAPMQVYALLPKGNCRDCGQATCFQFALKLIAGEATIEDCPPLLRPEFAEQRAQLAAIL